jgi:hypothetical protein
MPSATPVGVLFVVMHGTVGATLVHQAPSQILTPEEFKALTPFLIPKPELYGQPLILHYSGATSFGSKTENSAGAGGATSPSRVSTPTPPTTEGNPSAATGRINSNDAVESSVSPSRPSAASNLIFPLDRRSFYSSFAPQSSSAMSQSIERERGSSPTRQPTSPVTFLHPHDAEAAWNAAQNPESLASGFATSGLWFLYSCHEILMSEYHRNSFTFSVCFVFKYSVTENPSTDSDGVGSPGVAGASSAQPGGEGRKGAVDSSKNASRASAVHLIKRFVTALMTVTSEFVRLETQFKFLTSSLEANGTFSSGSNASADPALDRSISRSKFLNSSTSNPLGGSSGLGLLSIVEPGNNSQPPTPPPLHHSSSARKGSAAKKSHHSHFSEADGSWRPLEVAMAQLYDCLIGKSDSMVLADDYSVSARPLREPKPELTIRPSQIPVRIRRLPPLSKVTFVMDLTLIEVYGAVDGVSPIESLVSRVPGLSLEVTMEATYHLATNGYLALIDPILPTTVYQVTPLATTTVALQKDTLERRSFAEYIQYFVGKSAAQTTSESTSSSPQSQSSKTKALAVRVEKASPAAGWSASGVQTGDSGTVGSRDAADVALSGGGSTAQPVTADSFPRSHTAVPSTPPQQNPSMTVGGGGGSNLLPIELLESAALIALMAFNFKSLLEVQEHMRSRGLMFSGAFGDWDTSAMTALIRFALAKGWLRPAFPST